MPESSDIVPSLVEQRDAIRDWIEDEAPYSLSDQRHLVESSPERAYWHHGYQAALDDVVRLLTASGPEARIVGRPN